MEIDQQHLFTFEHAFGEGSGFIDFALFVSGMLFIKIVSVEIVMDFFGDFADQFVHIQAGKHRVGDGDQDAEVIAFPA